MKWQLPWHRKREAREGLYEAQQLRQDAEARLSEAERVTIRPLRQMRRENHITESLIRQLREDR